MDREKIVEMGNTFRSIQMEHGMVKEFALFFKTFGNEFAEHARREHRTRIALQLGHLACAPDAKSTPGAASFFILHNFINLVIHIEPNLINLHHTVVHPLRTFNHIHH